MGKIRKATAIFFWMQSRVMEVSMGKKMDCGSDDFSSIMGNDRLRKAGDDPLRIHK